MKKTIFAVVIVLAAIVLLSSWYTVREDQYACVFRFSEIVDTRSEAGIYFKIPFIDDVTYYTKATQLYDIPPSEVLTSDKQNMTVDFYILWSISDPQQFYRSLGSTLEAENRLNTISYTAVKNTMSTLAQADIINMNDGAERNDIYEGITETVDAQARAYGITVQDVKIKQFDLPDSNRNAVYQRMISERNQMAEKYTAEGNKDAAQIRNTVDKEVNIMISNAEAKAAKTIALGEQAYMQRLAQAYDDPEKQEFYAFILAIEALQASLTGEDKTIILDADSELAKLLTGSNQN